MSDRVGDGRHQDPVRRGVRRGLSVWEHRWLKLGVAMKVEHRHEHVDGLIAVCDCVMQLDDQRNVSVGEPFKQNHLPEWTGAVEPFSCEASGECRQHVVVGGIEEHLVAEVLVDIEFTVVEATRVIEAERHFRDRLTQSGNEVHAPRQHATNPSCELGNGYRTWIDHQERHGMAVESPTLAVQEYCVGSGHSPHTA